MITIINPPSKPNAGPFDDAQVGDVFKSADGDVRIAIRSSGGGLKILDINSFEVNDVSTYSKSHPVRYSKVGTIDVHNTHIHLQLK